MKRIIASYLIINITLAIIFFSIINIPQWDIPYFKEYGFISYLIIALSAMLVFFGTLIFFKLDPSKLFVSYLFFTLMKNAILLYYCYEYRQITGSLILYLLFIYMILMIIEIIFILKFNKYESLEK